MTGITTIHDALRHVDPGAGHIRAIVHISHATDRSAVNSHAQFQFRMAFERLADFQRALRGRFVTIKEYQRHAVAGRDF